VNDNLDDIFEGITEEVKSDLFAIADVVADSINTHMALEIDSRSRTASGQWKSNNFSQISEETEGGFKYVINIRPDDLSEDIEVSDDPRIIGVDKGTLVPFEDLNRWASLRIPACSDEDVIAIQNSIMKNGTHDSMSILMTKDMLDVVFLQAVDYAEKLIAEQFSN